MRLAALQCSCRFRAGLSLQHVTLARSADDQAKNFENARAYFDLAKTDDDTPTRVRTCWLITGEGNWGRGFQVGTCKETENRGWQRGGGRQLMDNEEAGEGGVRRDGWRTVESSSSEYAKTTDLPRAPTQREEASGMRFATRGWARVPFRFIEGVV